MIPLRSSEPVERFPWGSVVLLSLWTLADLVSRVWPGLRADFLARFWFVPDRIDSLSTFSVLFHTGIFSLLVTLIFAWAFSPRLFERRGALFVVITGASGAALSLLSYRWIHPQSSAPVLAPEAFLGALLGAFMRRDIWGSVDTLVVGLGWIRVLEVPSYVLLFFWFFYLLIGNLLTSSPLADAPLLYWIPFISFLWGFVLDSIWDILKKWTSNSSSSGNSAANNS